MTFSKRRSFSLQKAAFCLAIDGLSDAERPSFGEPAAVAYKQGGKSAEINFPSFLD